MNLHEEFRALNDCFYYSSLHGRNLTLDFNDSDQCFEFIKDYYEAGRKNKVFAFVFDHLYRTEGKHCHTVSMYFLGCFLSRIADDYLKDFLSFNVHDLDYDFKYSWFLSCLYHDTASSIETQPFHIKPLSYYLGKNNISHIVYDHRAKVPYADLFTYPISLVKNYFQYRLEHCLCVDHGIIGGFLLFDRLRKNYDASWREHVVEMTSLYNGVIADSYDHFESRNLHWRTAQLDHFAIIADSIIGHNIWVSDDVALYNHYGLSPLIKSPTNKIRIRERPVLFFLSLIDSIDPVKILNKEPNVLEPVPALQSIDVRLDGANTIIITSLSIQHFDSYYSKVKKTEDWLDVVVGDIDNNSFTITIN